MPAFEVMDNDMQPLTLRERQVLLLTKRGLSHQTIAAKLYLTTATIDLYWQQSIHKMAQWRRERETAFAC